MGNSPTKHHKERPKKNVHWKSAEPPSAPGKPTLVPGTADSAPDVVVISWAKPRYDGGSPIIGYLVEHRRTGSPHWVKATPLLVPYPEISLSGLEPGWRYQFRIVAENAVGKSEPSEISDPLTVTLQRNAITAPHFTTELRETTAIESEKVEFRVNIIGTPTPQISWFKDGFEIFSSRRTKILTENTISTLTIHQASLTDEGEIKCTATNRAGHVVTRAKLKIEAPPKIRLPRQYEDGLIIEADEIVRLKVGIAGRPPPNVIWSHNGEVISNDSHHELETNEKNSFLKINNSLRSDRGEYHIKAVNSLGEDNASFLVTVTARPQPPGKVAITMSLGKTVTLSWSAPDDDGGCKIGNYVVEYFRQGWNVWLKAITTRQLSTTLNDLIEGSEYKFRVKAENPYGLSDPSQESDVVNLPGPKRSDLHPDSLESELKPILKPRSPRQSTLGLTMPDNISNKSNSSEKMNRGPRTPTSVHFIPQIYESENMGNEMSYGTPFSPNSSGEPKRSFIEKSTPTVPVPLVLNNKVVDERPLDVLKTDPVILEPEKHVEPPKVTALVKPSKPVAEELHNSTEFMLVFCPDREKENVKKQTSSFDLNIEDSITSPAISLSAPDLSAEPPEMPMMRHSVSSTELLYERAMSRFYQAVAYEEAENAKKRSQSIISRDTSLQPRGRLGSFTENENRNLHKRFSDDEISSNLKKLTNITTNEEKVGSVHEMDTVESDFNEDYTDSTASSDESETEKFRRAVQSANIKKAPENPEEDTYHPRTPLPSSPIQYRPPDLDQAVEVLSRPLPLPNPDFVPKPILKRPSVEKENQKNSPKSKQKRKIINKLFDRENKEETSIGKKLKEISKEEEMKISNENNSEKIKVVNNQTKSVNSKISAEKKKMLELRQDSIEENKVVIDHYSDIVRERGIGRSTKVPLYMNSEELKKTVGDCESEEEIEEVIKSQLDEKIVTEPPAKTTRKLSFSDEITYNIERSPILQRKLSETNLKRDKFMNQNIDLSNLNSNGNLMNSSSRSSSSSKLTTPRTSLSKINTIIQPQQDANEVVEPRRPRTASKTRNRSRSNSSARNPSDPQQPPNQVRRQIRNPSRSPSVTNRLRPETPTLHQQNQIRLLNNLKNNSKLSPPSISPEPRARTPEVEMILAEHKVRSTMNYFTDLALFLVACWLYLFKDARLAIPVLALIVYRQLSDAVKNRLPSWMNRKKS